MFTDTSTATAAVKYPPTSSPRRDRPLTARGPRTLFHSISTARVAKAATTQLQYCTAGAVSSIVRCLPFAESESNSEAESEAESRDAYETGPVSRCESQVNAVGSIFSQ